MTRFNLLLLEEGELFFEDYAAKLYLPGNEPNVEVSKRKQLSGRLKVASKNLIFEPHSIQHPIMRLPYREMKSLHMDKSKQHLIVISSQVVEMKSHNIVGAYNFIDIKNANSFGVFIFEPSFSKLDDFVGLVAQIYSINKMTKKEAKKELENLIHEREKAVPFDSSWFKDLDEVKQLGKPLIVSKLTPLVELRGQIQMTQKRVYFQPFHSQSSSPMIRYDLTDIQYIYKRRHIMRHIALELIFTKTNQKSLSPRSLYHRRSFSSPNNALLLSLDNQQTSNSYNTDSETNDEKWNDNSHNNHNNHNNNRNRLNVTNSNNVNHVKMLSYSQGSYDTLLLSFEDQKIRDSVYDIFCQQNSVQIKQSPNLSYMTKQWVNGNLSNFDYLMFLNQCGGRSFNDLTQYPIFPWIIVDYTSESIDLNDESIYRDLSKPVGALNPQRLQKIQERYLDMPDEVKGGRFMYGSHYSTPGYVMYFLVRQCPEYMIKFQNGKFDAPDRLFSSIERTWKSAYNSLTDVKELIPQFYEGDGSFLLNNKNLSLGVRTDKTEVNNVELPPWANDNPKEFVKILRDALESDYVSKRLNQWIDLIFGYKQRGLAAEKANNVFYYLTYEGAVDMDKIIDTPEYTSIKMQIHEFGQTPSQLFDSPHPPKKSQSEIIRASLKLSDQSSNEMDMNHNSNMNQNLNNNNSTLFSMLGNGNGNDNASGNVSGNASGSASGSESNAISGMSPPQYETIEPIHRSNKHGKHKKKHRKHKNKSKKLRKRKSSNTSEASSTTSQDGDLSDINDINDMNEMNDINSIQHRRQNTVPNGPPPPPPPRRQLHNKNGLSVNSIDHLRKVRGSPLPSPPLSTLDNKNSNSKSLIRRNLTDTLPTHSEIIVKEKLDRPNWKSLNAIISSYSRYGSVNMNDSNHNNGLISNGMSDDEIADFTTITPHSHRITDLCISPDDEYLYSTSHDSTLSIYSFADQKTLKSIKISHLALSSICCMKDERENIIAVGSWDNTLYIYHNILNQVTQSLHGHNDAVSCLCSIENALCSGSWDNTIKIWQWKNDGMMHDDAMTTYETAHQSEIRCLSNSFTNSNIFVAGDESGNIYLYDIRSNNVKTAVRSWPRGHKDEITSMCWLPNKFEFLSCSSDCSIRQWDANTGKLIAHTNTSENLSCIKTDGNLIATGGELGSVRLWKFDTANRRMFDEINRHCLVCPNPDAISVIDVSYDGTKFIVGTKEFDDNIVMFNLSQSYHNGNSNNNNNNNNNSSNNYNNNKAMNQNYNYNYNYNGNNNNINNNIEMKIDGNNKNGNSNNNKITLNGSNDVLIPWSEHESKQNLNEKMTNLNGNETRKHETNNKNNLDTNYTSYRKKFASTKSQTNLNSSSSSLLDGISKLSKSASNLFSFGNNNNNGNNGNESNTNLSKMKTKSTKPKQQSGTAFGFW